MKFEAILVYVSFLKLSLDCFDFSSLPLRPCRVKKWCLNKYGDFALLVAILFLVLLRPLHFFLKMMFKNSVISKYL